MADLGALSTFRACGYQVCHNTSFHRSTSLVSHPCSRSAVLLVKTSNIFSRLTDGQAVHCPTILLRAVREVYKLKEGVSAQLSHFASL